MAASRERVGRLFVADMMNVLEYVSVAVIGGDNVEIGEWLEIRYGLRWYATV